MGKIAVVKFRAPARQKNIIQSFNPPSKRIITKESLDYQILSQLLKGHILAIRVPGYYSRSGCEALCERLDNHGHLNKKYDNAPELNIYRMGMSFFETRFNETLVDEYFRVSSEYFTVLKEFCAPYDSPFERFVADLKQVWPQGANRQLLNDKPMMPGLVRTFLEGQVFPPHQDMLIRDYPDLPTSEHPLSQLAVNVYLRNFDRGGELEIWDYAPDDTEVKSLYTGTHDFIDRQKIPKRSIRLRPQAGELILVQSSKLHAVRAGYGGKRTSFSCFTAYRGSEQPLTYWV